MAEQKVTKLPGIKDMAMILTVILPLLQALFAAVKEFETPGATGEEKKAAVLGFMEKILEKVLLNNPNLNGFKDFIMEFLSDAIDAAVWAYNKIKKFEHKAA